MSSREQQETRAIFHHYAEKLARSASRLPEPAKELRLLSEAFERFARCEEQSVAKRGEPEARQFAEAIIQTLTSEQNRYKGDWRDESLLKLREGLKAEVWELREEISRQNLGDFKDREDQLNGLRLLMAEAADVGAYSMFVWDKARHELEDG